MSDPLLDRGGVQVDANSLYARLSQQAQAQVDAKMREWFGHDSELAGYNEGAVKELGKHTI